MSDDDTVRRTVRSDDPSLSPEANRLLTDELRAAVGRDEVEVPSDLADRRRDRHGGRSPLVTMLVANRVLIGIAFAILITVGVIASLATGSWWLLAVAAGVHAVGTLAVAAFAITLTTQVEHVDPATAARLEAEGVADPDQVLSELAQEHAGARDPRGAAEVVATGRNENQADATRDPARAGVEQRTAMTPAAGATAPEGSGSVIGWMPVAVVASLVVLTLALAIAEGGAVWLVPTIVWGAAALWLYVVLRVDGRAEQRAAQGGDPQPAGAAGRAPGGAGAAARRSVVPALAVVVVGVVGFCALMALVVANV